MLCVLTTTSCFAPRAPDRLLEVSELCARFDVPHLVNNAYGLQSASICRQLQRVGEAIVRDAHEREQQLQQEHRRQQQTSAAAASGGNCCEAAAGGGTAQSVTPLVPPEAAASSSARPRYRLDAFVQSTDKNLLTPVGGTIIATFNPQILNRVAQTYPGLLTCNR